MEPRNTRLAAAIAVDGRPNYVIAAEARVNPNIIGGFISGRLQPSADQQARIALVLGLPAEELFAS